ncbi:hypothetical protein [Nodosilinea sp. E11]|uniref:hypothetical protein n=1 Tax=Nodosilinea sp. E11 TaxID=3037479 RepID=UPI0029347892|nr:hypothetical protein [Nodosilinea sp. E11]WOD38781.1 hypothetical protein RRF56_21495 [Nodosilinea sp. E11]
MGIWTDTVINSWADGMQSVLLGPVQNWLAAHPLLSWLVGHPLVAGAVAGVALLLFAGLWSAIARLTEGFWLSLVKLPFQLSGWIFGALSGLLVRRWVKPSATAESRDRLSEIVARLEMLQTEQETLMAELRTLLKQDARLGD